LNQLANRAHAPIAEMIDVISSAFTVIDTHHLAHDLDEIVGRQNAGHDGGIEAEAFVDLVAANFAQVVTAEVEEQRIEQ